MKRKVVHITNFGTLGGVQSYLYGVNSKDNNSLLLSTRKPLDFYLKQKNIKKNISSLSFFSLPFVFDKKSLVIHNLILSKIWPFLCFSQKLAKKPLIYHEHGIAWHSPIKNRKKYIKRISKVDCVIVNSRATARLLKEKYLITKKINVLKCPIFLYDNAKKTSNKNFFRNSLEKGYLKIGFMGRLEAHKNPIFLLELARTLNQVYGLKAEIDFLGLGSQINFLKSQALEMKVNAKFVGLVKNRKKFIEKWDFAIYPSLREPLGLVQGEMALMGKLCLSSNVDGIPEVYPRSMNELLIKMVRSSTITNYQENFQFIPELDDFSQNFSPDIDDCCVKILRIVKNPELYQKILNKHRKFLASNFCIDKHIIELNKLLGKYSK